MGRKNRKLVGPPGVEHPEIVVPAAFRVLTDDRGLSLTPALRREGLSFGDAADAMALLRALGFLTRNRHRNAAGQIMAEQPGLRAVFLAGSVTARYEALRVTAPSPDETWAALAWLAKYGAQLRTLAALNEQIRRYDQEAVGRGFPPLGEGRLDAPADQAA